MKKIHRKSWKITIGIKKHDNYNNINKFYQLINKSIDIM
jgi:hypothetical protein